MNNENSPSVVLKVQNVLLAVWVGAMISIGYIAAPVLFKALDDRKLAGALAGEMFFIVSIIGVVVGTVLIVAYTMRSKSAALTQWRFWLLLIMSITAFSSLFVIQPMMADLKAQGLAPGSDAAATFGKLHGVSSIMHLMASVSGLVLLFNGLRPRNAG